VRSYITRTSVEVVDSLYKYYLTQCSELHKTTALHKLV